MDLLALQEVRVSGFRPTCPLCDEINPPEADGCVFCGAALTMDEHDRRKRASMYAAAQFRSVTPQPVDNSVDENLLALPYDDDLHSPDDVDRS